MREQIRKAAQDSISQNALNQNTTSMSLLTLEVGKGNSTRRQANQDPSNSGAPMEVNTGRSGDQYDTPRLEATQGDH